MTKTKLDKILGFLYSADEDDIEAIRQNLTEEGIVQSIQIRANNNIKSKQRDPYLESLWQDFHGKK